MAKGKNDDNDTNSDKSETTTLSSSGNVSPKCRKPSYDIFTNEEISTKFYDNFYKFIYIESDLW